MLNNFNTEKDMQLDPQLASQMLSNIFDACEIEENTVPLEVLTSYSNYRKERYLLQKFVIVFLMILFFLLPILFIAPKFTVELKESDVVGKPYVEVVVSSMMPIEKITAMSGEKKVPVYEMADGSFQVVPDKNGTVDVTVELANQQYATKTIEVEGVDTKAPRLVSSKKQEGQLILYFEEESGLLDYDNIYAATASGEIIKPISYQPSELSVTFQYPKEPVNVFVPDTSDNTLQVIVTIK